MKKSIMRVIPILTFIVGLLIPLTCAMASNPPDIPKLQLEITPDYSFDSRVSYKYPRVYPPSPEPVEEPTEEPSPEPSVEPYVPTIEEVLDADSAAYQEMGPNLFYFTVAIYKEAGGNACSDTTRLYVGSVILNRVADERFPSTMYDVLMQKRQYNDFYWNGIRFPKRAWNAGEAHAVIRAYNTAKQLLNEGSQLPVTYVWQAEFKQGCAKYKYQEGMDLSESGVYVYQDGLYFCQS